MNNKNAPIEPALHAAPSQKIQETNAPSSDTPSTPAPLSGHGSAIDQVLRGELQYGSETAPLIKQAISKLNFEQGIVYLEEIVKQIENAPGNLDQNTQLYTVGELLRLHCDNKLKQNEAQVEQIIKDTQGDAAATDPLKI